MYTMLFYFERGWYFPNAAHKAEDFVSMNWAGTHSENKASVWLMMHLSDQLTVAQLEEIAEIVGLTKQKDETQQEYRIRVRDRYGVISTHKDLEQIAFSHAKRDVLSKVPEAVSCSFHVIGVWWCTNRETSSQEKEKGASWIGAFLD